MNPSPGRSLLLQTYDETNIPNSIEPDPAQNYVRLAEQSWRMQILSATRLGIPTGRYNCHGLTFASRRTCLGKEGDPKAVDNLLQRDLYKLVYQPQIGDIVVYRDKQSKEIEHTGFVVTIEKIDFAAEKEIIRVWSMWGSIGEFLHKLQNTPYDDCIIEFWRLGQ